MEVFLINQSVFNYFFPLIVFVSHDTLKIQNVFIIEKNKHVAFFLI